MDSSYSSEILRELSEKRKEWLKNLQVFSSDEDACGVIDDAVSERMLPPSDQSWALRFPYPMGISDDSEDDDVFEPKPAKKRKLKSESISLDEEFEVKNENESFKDKKRKHQNSKIKSVELSNNKLSLNLDIKREPLEEVKKHNKRRHSSSLEVKKECSDGEKKHKESQHKISKIDTSLHLETKVRRQKSKERNILSKKFENTKNLKSETSKLAVPICTIDVNTTSKTEPNPAFVETIPIVPNCGYILADDEVEDYVADPSRFLSSSDDETQSSSGRKPISGRRLHDLSTTSSGSESENSNSRPTKSKPRRAFVKQKSAHCISSSEEDEPVTSSKNTEIGGNSSIFTTRTLNKPNDSKLGNRNSPKRAHVNTSAWKNIANVPVRPFESKASSSNKTFGHHSIVSNLKKQLAASNLPALEIRKQINDNERRKEIICKRRLEEARNKSLTEDRMKGKSSLSRKENMSNNLQQIENVPEVVVKNQNPVENNYTVNVNVYCSPSQEIGDKNQMSLNENHNQGRNDSKNKLDINLSLIHTPSEDCEGLPIGKKVRVAHNRRQSEQQSNHERTDGDKSKMRSIERTQEKLAEGFETFEACDILSNIMSQMDNNPYKVQKTTKETPVSKNSSLVVGNLMPPNSKPDSKLSNCNLPGSPYQGTSNSWIEKTTQSAIKVPSFNPKISPSINPLKEDLFNKMKVETSHHKSQQNSASDGSRSSTIQNVYTCKSQQDSVTNTPVEETQAKTQIKTIVGEDVLTQSPKLVIPFYSATQDRGESSKETASISSESMILLQSSSKLNSNDSQNIKDHDYGKDKKNEHLKNADTKRVKRYEYSLHSRKRINLSAREPSSVSNIHKQPVSSENLNLSMNKSLATNVSGKDSDNNVSAVVKRHRTSHTLSSSEDESDSDDPSNSSSLRNVTDEKSNINTSVKRRNKEVTKISQIEDTGSKEKQGTSQDIESSSSLQPNDKAPEINSKSEEKKKDTTIWGISHTAENEIPFLEKKDGEKEILERTKYTNFSSSAVINSENHSHRDKNNEVNRASIKSSICEKETVKPPKLSSDSKKEDSKKQKDTDYIVLSSSEEESVDSENLNTTPQKEEKNRKKQESPKGIRIRFGGSTFRVKNNDQIVREENKTRQPLKVERPASKDSSSDDSSSSSSSSSDDSSDSESSDDDKDKALSSPTTTDAESKNTVDLNEKLHHTSDVITLLSDSETEDLGTTTVQHSVNSTNGSKDSERGRFDEDTPIDMVKDQTPIITSLFPETSSNNNTNLNPGTRSNNNTNLDPGTSSNKNTNLDPGKISNNNTNLVPETSSNNNTILDPGTSSNKITNLDPGTSSNNNTNLVPETSSNNHTNLDHGKSSDYNTNLVPETSSNNNTKTNTNKESEIGVLEERSVISDSQSVGTKAITEPHDKNIGEVNKCIGKIRIKSLQELGIVSESPLPENALKTSLNACQLEEEPLAAGSREILNNPVVCEVSNTNEITSTNHSNVAPPISVQPPINIRVTNSLSIPTTNLETTNSSHITNNASISTSHSGGPLLRAPTVQTIRPINTIPRPMYRIVSAGPRNMNTNLPSSRNPQTIRPLRLRLVNATPVRFPNANVSSSVSSEIVPRAIQNIRPRTSLFRLVSAPQDSRATYRLVDVSIANQQAEGLTQLRLTNANSTQISTRSLGSDSTILENQPVGVENTAQSEIQRNVTSAQLSTQSLFENPVAHIQIPSSDQPVRIIPLQIGTSQNLSLNELSLQQVPGQTKQTLSIAQIGNQVPTQISTQMNPIQSISQVENQIAPTQVLVQTEALQHQNQTTTTSVQKNLAQNLGDLEAEVKSQKENIKSYFNIFDEFFTELTCIKIPKLVDDLHLLITYDIIKDEKLQKVNQLLHPETIASETRRAEKDFADMVKTRAQGFVPLLMTILKKVEQPNVGFSVMALYCRMVQLLGRINPINLNYRYKLRFMIKAMLEKQTAAVTVDISVLFLESEKNFIQKFDLMFEMLEKYDLYVETCARIAALNQSVQTKSNKEGPETSSENDSTKRPKAKKVNKTPNNVNQPEDNQEPSTSGQKSRRSSTDHQQANTSRVSTSAEEVQNKSSTKSCNPTLSTQSSSVPEAIGNLDQLLLGNFLESIKKTSK